jgi:hypothetical protein
MVTLDISTFQQREADIAKVAGRLDRAGLLTDGATRGFSAPFPPSEELA